MQSQCLLNPNYMTATTQLFSLQLPSDLVSIWFHTTTIWWFWMLPFTDLEFRLPEMLSSTFQSAWTASKPHMPARGTNSQHWWLEAGADSKELIFAVSSTTKRDQMALLLGTTANCTTLDVVMTACKLPHLQLTSIQVLYSTVRWEIQMKIPGYNISMMCEWGLGALWFVASLPECWDRPTGLGASFSSMDSAVSPQDCQVLGTVAQCHQRQGKKGRA